VAIASVDGCSLLLPGGGSAVTVHPDMTAWPSLHERLALVRAGEAPAWRAERGPLVVWVGAREPGSRERDGGAALTVSPVPAGGAPVLLDVCGCALQPVRGVPAGVR
jgi:hypothetical protein